MRWVRNAALAAAMMMVSFSAQATTYIVSLTGTVTSQVDPGADPNISVGDTVTMSGHFTADRIFDNGSFRAAVMYGLPPSGNYFWNVQLNGLTWMSSDDEFDGLPFDFDSKDHPLAFPYFELLPGGKIGVPQGFLTRANSDTPPRFYLGSGQIRSGDFLYGNTSKTPGFNVTWNLSGGRITAVPEAATWAMMIAGFGLVGAAARRRKAAPAFA